MISCESQYAARFILFNVPENMYSYGKIKVCIGLGLLSRSMLEEIS